jgi:hypothetical protein
MSLFARITDLPPRFTAYMSIGFGGCTSAILNADRSRISSPCILILTMQRSSRLASRWMFEGHEAIPAVGIGGSGIRVGVVKLHLKKAADKGKCVEDGGVASPE